MTKYLPYLFCLLIVSCASNEESSKEKNYSTDTNRAFEMIERGYLKPAPGTNAPAPQIASPKKPSKPVAPVEETPTPPPAQKINNAKVDERLIEINQNLAFYCMKHRKDPVYGGDESKCMSFVNKTMQTCQKHHRIVNTKLLHCIQAKLKKNR